MSVRLCPGPPIVAYDGTIYDVGIQPPEVLTTRIGELVDTVNSLEPAPQGIGCPLDGGPRLTYWFAYPDGDVRAVTFEHFGCEVLIVGQGAQRLDGARLARLFTQALLVQRAAGEPPVKVPAAPDCPGVFADPGTPLPHEPVDLASASLCVEAGSYRVRQAEVPAELLGRLESGLLAERDKRQECAELELRHAVIFGFTSWGDRVRYSLDACGRVMVPRPPGWLREDETVFRLSPELASQLDALPLGHVIRFTDPTSKTAPPSSPG